MSDTSTPRITPQYSNAPLTHCITKSIRHTDIQPTWLIPPVPPHAKDKHNFLFK